MEGSWEEDNSAEEDPTLTARIRAKERNPLGERESVICRRGRIRLDLPPCFPNNESEEREGTKLTVKQGGINKEP